MPDNDLGSAHGRIVITSDTAGADKAAASMVALSAEAEALKGRMKEQGIASDDLAKKHEALATRIEAQSKASQELKDKERDLAAALDDISTKQGVLNTKTVEVSKARTELNRQTRAVVEAEKLLQAEVARSAQSLDQVISSNKRLTDAMGEAEEAAKDLGKGLDEAAQKALTLSERQQGLTQRHREAAKAAAEARQAEADYNRILNTVASTVDQINEAQNKAATSRKAYTDATKIAAEAERAFREELALTNEETARLRRDAERDARASSQSLGFRRQGIDPLGNFSSRDQRDLNDILKRTRHLDPALPVPDDKQTVAAYKRIQSAVHDARTSVDQYAASIGNLVKIDNSVKSLSRLVDAITSVRHALTTGLLGGGAVGGAGLLGAGGAEGVTALVGSMSELVGIVGLLPGAIAGAGAAIGTLVVGFHGVQQALSSMGNVREFAESVRFMAPAAKEALITIQSFYSSFKGAMNVVQDSLFRPILDDIKPLIYTYLPLLMNAGSQIAGVFGQAGHLFAAWLQTPQTIQTIQQFFGNVTSGLQAALPAINAFSNAFLTISTVGSGFFQQLGTAFAGIGKEFNNFVNGAAQSGGLQAFIQTGINGFQVLFHNMIQVGAALSNIFLIGNSQGGGFLSMFKNIGDEFRSWTQSAGGQQSITNFFQLLQQAGAALHPILRTVGSTLATIAGAITRLGIASQSGIGNFFTSLQNAVVILGPALIQSAPAINIFLTALGKLIEGVVGALGPSLPSFLEKFAESATSLVGPATSLAGALAKLVDHLTPDEIKAIGLFAIGMQTLGKVIPIVTGAFALLDAVLSLNPFVAIALAIGAVITALVLLYQHNETVRNVLKKLWEDLQNLDVGQVLSGTLKGFEELIGKLYNWGKKAAELFAQGIIDAADTVGGAVQGLAEKAYKALFQNSPAQEGPLSVGGGTQGWGENFSNLFAQGISSGGDNVGQAAYDVAGKAAGGLAYTGAVDPSGRRGGSGGTSGANAASSVLGPGGATNGDDGFMSWVKRLGTNALALSHIFSEATQILVNTASLGLKALDIGARLYNGGVNSLTEPGGFDQGAKPFIPQTGLPGQSPVPGVPQVGFGGAYKPGSAGSGGVYGPPSPAPSTSAPPSASNNLPGVPGKLTPDQQANAMSIIQGGRARGWNDDQIKAALAIASDESHLTNSGKNFDGGNASVGGVQGVFQQSPGWHPTGDAQHDINTFLDTFDANLKAAGPGADPLKVAAGVQQHGGPGAISPWQGTGGDNWYLGQVQNAIQNNPDYAGAVGLLGQGGTGGRGAFPAGGLDRLGAAIAQARGIAPGGNASYYSNPASRASFPLGGTTTEAFKRSNDPNPPIYAPGTNSGGYGNTNGLPQWAIQLGAQFGLIPSTYPEGGTLHQAGYAMDFSAPAGTDKDEAARRMDAFSNYIQQNLTPQTLELIHYNSRTGQHWGIAGAQPVGPGTAYPDYNARDWAGHDDYGSEPHVHWATDVPPLGIANQSTGFPLAPAPNGGAGNPSQTATGGTPASPSGNGITIPGWAQNLAAGGGLLGVLGLGQYAIRAAYGTVGPAMWAARSAWAADAADAILGGVHGVTVTDAATGAAAAGGGIGAGALLAGGAAGAAGLLAGASAFGWLDNPNTSDQAPPFNPGPKAPGAGQQSPPPPPNGGSGGVMTQDEVNAWAKFHGQDPNDPFYQRLVKGPAAPAPGGGQQSPPPPPNGGSGPPQSVAGLSGHGSLPIHVQPFSSSAQATVSSVTPPPPIPQPGAPGSPAQTPSSSGQFPSPGLGPGDGGGYIPGSAGSGNVLGPPSPGTGNGNGQQSVPGVPQGNAPTSAVSGFQMATSIVSGVGNIASSVFQTFDSIVQSFEAFGDLVDTAAKLPKNSEQVIGMVKDIQQFISTGASIAQTTSSIFGTIASIVGAGAAADPTGGTAAAAGALSAVSAISGLVSDALTTVNAGITLGIDVYHQATKMAANLYGFTLGGPNTGWLGGNVQELLNTNTGQLYTYNDANPLNKNTLTPGLQNAYTHTNANQGITYNVANVYAGPGETTSAAFSNAMWQIQTAPNVASAAGKK